MSDLVLHVKRLYFDQIAAGEKVEEYRLVTPYWTRRLAGREYARVVILAGYPRRDDATRRLVFAWQGCKRRVLIHPHFGAEPVEVFAIRLGARIEGGL